MNYFILTDLEGVAGVDSFAQTRTRDIPPKLAGMKQLAREVNACVEGIKSVDPDAVVDVLDGHGPGGLLAEDLVGCRYMRGIKDRSTLFQGYDALLFVGQHAMAGTIDGPLCHTYSSLHIAYYRLNGIYIGEFAARALLAGAQGVPTIFLSGDDKAVCEAKMFIPDMETATVKWGTGLESARHLSQHAACDAIREGAIRAVKRIGEFTPYTGIEPPYTFEARFLEPLDMNNPQWRQPHITILDSRTYQIETAEIALLPF